MTPTPPPYSLTEARKFIKRIYAEGTVTYSKPHAEERMAKHKLSTVDIGNVLRAGAISEHPELENGAWRYRVHTNKIVVIVEIWSENRIFIVTAWRIR
jgi:hypothetical protein